MKILLVTPYNRSYVIMPSLGLGYLASIARKAGHDVEILHCIKENIRLKEFEKYISTQHFDLIGFQAFSYDLPVLKRYLEIIKQKSRDTITVAGGAHPSGDPYGTLAQLPYLDFAFKGESEIGFESFLRYLETNSPPLSEISGLIYRSNGGIVVNETRFVEDLDSIPMPAWDIIKPENYPEAPHGAFTKNFPTAPIIITRGCPCPCTFCAGKTVTGVKMRARSVENVIEEIKYLKNYRGIKEFHIEDENLTLRKSLVMEFCERLLKEEIGMSWSLPAGVSIDTFDREMLILMERAGLYSIALGIEFGSQRMLDITKKRLTIEKIREKLELFKGLNIKKTGFFLFAVPGETIQEMKETIKFALSLPLDRAQFNNFMPLPGSALWEDLKKNNKLNEIEWNRFYVHDVGYVDEGYKRSDIKRLQRIALLRFYLRPKIIMNIIGEIRSIWHLKFLLKRIIDALK